MAGERRLCLLLDRPLPTNETMAIQKPREGKRTVQAEESEEEANVWKLGPQNNGVTYPLARGQVCRECGRRHGEPRQWCEVCGAIF